VTHGIITLAHPSDVQPLSSALWPPHDTWWTIFSAQWAPASLMRAPTRDTACTMASQPRASSLKGGTGDPWYHCSSSHKWCSATLLGCLAPTRHVVNNIGRSLSTSITNARTNTRYCEL
jgi:hypothetical protein